MKFLVALLVVALAFCYGVLLWATNDARKLSERLGSGSDTTYTMKVVSVDHGAQRLEAKFIVMPQDLRLVCHGEAKKVFAGDYVKVEFKGGKTTIAGADCDQVLWLR